MSITVKDSTGGPMNNNPSGFSSKCYRHRTMNYDDAQLDVKITKCQQRVKFKWGGFLDRIIGKENLGLILYSMGFDGWKEDERSGPVPEEFFKVSFCNFVIFTNKNQLLEIESSCSKVGHWKDSIAISFDRPPSPSPSQSPSPLQSPSSQSHATSLVA
ncbi:hypothetical protein M0802_004883 [Mischocyttarus mexicanus]|nr:hypothetical protein M0802_004883 [Mischocyttarus mexicanus]